MVILLTIRSCSSLSSALMCLLTFLTLCLSLTLCKIWEAGALLPTPTFYISGSILFVEDLTFNMTKKKKRTEKPKTQTTKRPYPTELPI